MELWDFKSGNRNEILNWIKTLSLRDRAALDQKLDLLERLDFDQASSIDLLKGPINKSKHILKLRTMADKALRPLLCRGPFAFHSEYTLLIGAEERDFKLHPSGCIEKALANRGLLLNDAGKRVKHERA